jgi:DNA-binding transcriptional LysR family regulator
VSKGFRLTPRAEALQKPLADVLGGISSLVASGPSDLADLEQTLRLSVADYGIAVFIGPLLASLARHAPGLDLVCLPWFGAEEAHAALEAGTLELAISVLAPSNLRSRPILDESYVVAMREGHPAQPLTLARWVQFPHIVVSGRGSPSGPLDSVLAERGQRRRVGVVVPSFFSVPSLLRDSDHLALVPETLARLSSGITWSEPPLPVPGFQVCAVWHPRRDADLALCFVRDEIAALATRLPTPPARAVSRRRRKQQKG